jgi:dUTP pyrophosphatase
MDNIIKGEIWEDDVKIENPERGTKYSAGYDLKVHRELVIPAGESIQYESLYKFKIPREFYANLTTRSSLSIKRKIIMLPTNSIIDADYTDNVVFCLHNIGQEDVVINPGERVAQVLFKKYHILEDDVTHLDDSKQRTGGIGSTDVVNN